MDLQDVVRNAEALSGLCRFGSAPACQRRSAHRRMSRVTVGAGDELDSMSQLRPQGRGSADADIAVVRMRAKRDDSELRPLRERGQRAGGCLQEGSAGGPGIHKGNIAEAVETAP